MTTFKEENGCIFRNFLGYCVKDISGEKRFNPPDCPYDSEDECPKRRED